VHARFTAEAMFGPLMKPLCSTPFPVTRSPQSPSCGTPCERHALEAKSKAKGTLSRRVPPTNLLQRLPVQRGPCVLA